MDPIRIKIKRHILTVIIELSIVISALALSLPDVVFGNKECDISLLLYYSLFILLIFIVGALLKRRWSFPVMLTIKEQCLYVDCMFLLLFHRHYSWKKEDVKIQYRQVSMGLKLSSIVVMNLKENNRVLFESVALKKETIKTILNEFKINEYEIDMKEGIGRFTSR